MDLGLNRLAFCVASLAIVNATACGSHSDDPPDGGTGGIGGAGANAGSGGTAGTAGTGGSTTGSGGSGGTTTGSGGSGGTTTSGTGGSGGTGGTGTGGSGTGGSGGVIISDSGRCGCVTGHVGWGWDGGLGFYKEMSALEACNLFVHRRVPTTPSPPVLSCEQPLGDCAGAIGAGDVVRAIAHADVQAAIAAAPVLYGEDPRAYDGQVLRIQLGSAIVEVGVPCRNAACKPIPAGVDALAKQLPSLTKQELARPPCSNTFPPAN